MHFTKGSFYHIYNRGNHRQTIFFREKNYLYFLDKVKKYIVPNANLLAWCLMPNHFHLLVQANEVTEKLIKERPIPINTLTEGIRLLLSTYSQGVQKQQNQKGNLFQQKTKSKCVDDYLTTVFHYIHQNALRSGLVDRIEDYSWCSFREYSDKMASGLCNTEIAYQFMNLDSGRFLEDSYAVIPNETISLFELE